MKKDGGNAGRWTPRKTNGRFPSAPTALGNRRAIPTFPPSRRSRGKVESQRQASHFPTARFAFTQNRKEARRRIALLPPSGSSRMRIKFHSPGSFFDENMLPRSGLPPAWRGAVFLRRAGHARPYSGVRCRGDACVARWTWPFPVSRWHRVRQRSG